jgi:hypothetical protein
MTALTSNVQKGGALLDDTRRLVEAWDRSLDADANLRDVAHGNLLGKTSRARTDDVLLRILKPRFVEPGPQVIGALATLLEHPTSFVEACYYEASRDDALLAAFAEGPLFDWYEQGRTGVATEDVKGWLAELGRAGRAPAWSENVLTKVARGLLAALRDFRVLQGGARKEYAVPRMSPRGFAYVAFREHEQGASSRALFTTRVWRRWLLDAARVAELFDQAERMGVLRFSQAGSAVRVDWRVGSLEEVARAAA